MSLTPLDVLHKEFRQSLRGLRERDVQEFLRQVANSLEETLAHNAELREKVQSLERRLLHYEKIEETMQNALVLAQKSAEDTRLGSQKQAEVILADAEQKRKQILEEARTRGADIEREYAELKQQRRMFEMEFRALLQAHLEALERRADGEPVEPPRLFTVAAREIETPEPEEAEEDAPLSALDWTRLEPALSYDEDEDDRESSGFRERALAGARAFGG